MQIAPALFSAKFFKQVEFKRLSIGQEYLVFLLNKKINLRKRKMQIAKNKIVAITIAIFLTFSMSASMMLIPNASAHSPPQSMYTIAFCNVAPNPIGLGQSVNIGFWLDIPVVTANGAWGDRYGPFTVHVTLPDGTNTTLGPFASDDTGGTHTQYIPTELGTYTFQMTFPGETLTGYTENPTAVGHPSTSVYVNDTLTPSTSNVATLTVQQEPVPSVPVAPLPTSYWQTPINAMNVNNWYVLGGPFLNLGGGYSAGTPGGKYNYTGNYNPYTTAPLASHIMWTKPVSYGGVLGGDFGGTTTYGNYYSTSQYERKYNPIVINGYIFYTVTPGSSTTYAANICVNLYNGQTVWSDDSTNYGGGSPEQTALTTAGIVTPLKCGQLLDYVSPNQFGGIAYLWTTGTPAGIVSTGTCLNMFDAMTGKYILSIVNGTSPTLAVDSGGDLIGYYTNSTAGTQIIEGQLVTTPPGGELLECWNSTQDLLYPAGYNPATIAPNWSWRPTQDGQILFSSGIMWAIPLATNYSGNALPSALAIWTINSGYIIFDSEAAGEPQGGWGIFAGYSLTTNSQVWIENLTLTPNTFVSLNDNWLAGDGVWLTNNDDTGVLTGYSMATGAQLWTDTLAPRDPYDSNGHSQGTIAGDNLYLFEFGGDIWSINMLTGTINWYTNTTEITGSAGDNTPYGVWPIWEQCGDGIAGTGSNQVLFLEEGHEYSPPLFLGAQQLALNCTNGQLIWTINAFDVDSDPIMAYGYMTILNAYDNQIYAYGMGPSKTTVSAPSVSATPATPVTITGSVMDISAGSQQEAVAANFPNGLPCVSDASMSQFMEAVYMQQPMPTNDTGVQVTLTAVDPNHNLINLGTTTTDSNGNYGFTWTPPTVPGSYQIIATFSGTNSYYGSSDSTYMNVQASATPNPTSAPVSGLATMSALTIGIVAAVIAIIIAISIVGLLLLRKRP